MKLSSSPRMMNCGKRGNAFSCKLEAHIKAGPSSTSPGHHHSAPIPLRQPYTTALPAKATASQLDPLADNMQLTNIFLFATLGAGALVQRDEHGQFICYGALQPGSVHCSRRGTSYYNCRPPAPSNKWTRGCSAITRCRSLMACPAGSKLAFVLDSGEREMLE
ncbi:hypothetical protein KVT40_007050 [Elsinoe batatas]|uniref:Uncharacterized protein n=1 Tax=Elsinoe batatas TaxID=2601811 RepID=A0A8K0KYV5_9PEZI|nr:hypothetical protein KVT40_007050 [Elsinoe batatas]